MDYLYRHLTLLAIAYYYVVNIIKRTIGFRNDIPLLIFEHKLLHNIGHKHFAVVTGKLNLTYNYVYLVHLYL